MIVISNNTTSMNSKSIFILRLAIVAIVTATLCVATTVWAVGEDFDVTGNPYLRHSTPKPKATATVAKAIKLSATDQKFLTEAVAAGIWEVENGRAAESKAESQATKSVASRLVAENSRINQEIINLAKKKGLALSATGARAQKIPAAHYDKNYLTLAKQDHQQNIRAFEKEAKSGNDPDIKNYAARTLPALRHQLNEVESALGKVK
jgi:putative membrane protein